MLLQIRILRPPTSPHPSTIHQWKSPLTPTLSHSIFPPSRLIRSTLSLLRSGFSIVRTFVRITLGMKQLLTDSFRFLWKISSGSFVQKSISWHPPPPPPYPPQSHPPPLLP